MRRFNSLRLRLTAFAIVVVVSAMIVTGVGLTFLFERNVERREGQELNAHLEQIIGGLRFDKDGSVKLARNLADPRFGRVFGGLYYQIASPSGEVILKSRSLWDTELDLPDDELTPGEVHIHTRPGPNNATLLLHESKVLIALKDEQLPIIVTVGIDKTEILALRAGFARDLVPALAALALVLFLGFSFQIRVGIRPLDRLRHGISDVKTGRAKRLPTDAPSEVTPLIAEVNSLLDQQDESMVRARDRAADLAHGLKTPLTALATDIERLRKIGAGGIASDIEELSTRMRRHLDRELARARDRHGKKNARTLAKPAIDSIIRTLEKTPKGEHQKFINNVPIWVELAVEQGDFLEITGNLLENASKFAANTISIESGIRDGWVSIIINDDGPGVAEARIAHITKRGVRLDTSGAGSGLGLAIAKDIVETYDGELMLANKLSSGLRATIVLPVAKTLIQKDTK